MYGRLIIVPILIWVSISVGSQLNHIMDFIHIDDVTQRDELMQLLDYGYTEICLDDYAFNKKYSSCIMNRDNYVTTFTSEYYNTQSHENSHCVYYANIDETVDGMNEPYCDPPTWGNDWPRDVWVLTFENYKDYDLLLIKNNPDNQKDRDYIEDRNPDTVRFK